MSLADSMDEQKASVIKDVKRMLQYYQALGFDSLPLSTKALVAAQIGSLPGGSVGSVSRKLSGLAAPMLKAPTVGQPTFGKNNRLMNLKEDIGDCHRCKLSKGRKNIVFGAGSADARLMFIGEAPEKEEDMRGEPFVGEAGMLLTKLIEKMGLKRDAVYIVNIIKCRPPMDREPEEDEIFSCRAFLDKQIDMIAPEFIITLGKTALMALTNNDKINITTARGRFFEYRGVPVMPTFHPDYLLLNPKDKWLTWADVQKVLERMNRSSS